VGCGPGIVAQELLQLLDQLVCQGVVATVAPFQKTPGLVLLATLDQLRHLARLLMEGLVQQQDLIVFGKPGQGLLAVCQPTPQTAAILITCFMKIDLS
jgi:hypothetical protein